MGNDGMDIFFIDTFGGEEFPDMVAVFLRVFFIIHVMEIADSFPVVTVFMEIIGHGAHCRADWLGMGEKMVFRGVFFQYFLCFF